MSNKVTSKIAMSLIIVIILCVGIFRIGDKDEIVANHFNKSPKENMQIPDMEHVVTVNIMTPMMHRSFLNPNPQYP